MIRHNDEPCEVAKEQTAREMLIEETRAIHDKAHEIEELTFQLVTGLIGNDAVEKDVRENKVDQKKVNDMTTILADLIYATKKAQKVSIERLNFLIGQFCDYSK